jgi:hypothetical protein
MQQPPFFISISFYPRNSPSHKRYAFIYHIKCIITRVLPLALHAWVLPNNLLVHILWMKVSPRRAAHTTHLFFFQYINPTGSRIRQNHTHTHIHGRRRARRIFILYKRDTYGTLHCAELECLNCYTAAARDRPICFVARRNNDDRAAEVWSRSQRRWCVLVYVLWCKKSMYVRVAQPIKYLHHQESKPHTLSSRPKHIHWIFQTV